MSPPLLMLGNGFTRKKVESLTLGERLRKLRSECSVNLTEIARHTGIRREYIELLERGEYTKLPADVYIRGFIRSYARCLGVDPKGLIRLYERERSIARNLGKEPEESLSAPKRKSKLLPLFVVTPKVLIGTAVSFAVFSLTAYLYREFRLCAAEPFIVVMEPRNGETVTSGAITVSGETDRDAKLFLNNELVLVGEDGKFQEQVRLQSGVNTLEFRVVNRFEKERRETVSVTADLEVPKSSLNVETGNEVVVSPPGRLTLSSKGARPISIFVRSGDRELYRGPLSPGDSKSFDCEKNCLVDSTSAAETEASWNGSKEEPLGKEAQPITDVELPVSPEPMQSEHNRKE